MSSSMSEREIEDVLNSVRRLVAQEERRSRATPLILTPAMRVGGDDPARGEPVESAPVLSAPEEEADAGDADAIDDRAGPTANLPDMARRGESLPLAMDEAALQQMVTQIVRDELHGKLGERITLAVRKLVRNEIARALDEERRK
mgnify:CR=1 FL=1